MLRAMVCFAILALLVGCGKSGLIRERYRSILR